MRYILFLTWYMTTIQSFSLLKQIRTKWNLKMNLPDEMEYNRKLELYENNRKYRERKIYPLSHHYYEQYIKRLHENNITIPEDSPFSYMEQEQDTNKTIVSKPHFYPEDKYYRRNNPKYNKHFLETLGLELEEEENENENSNMDEPHFETEYREENENKYRNGVEETRRKYPFFFEDKNKEENRVVAKSKNFEVMKQFNFTFEQIGGYENVKEELRQCIDILKYSEKYKQYNVRLPKGLILEGPPGTGKTLFAKGLAGEAKCNFIALSGADFQEMYVGVGSTRIKELFKLAKENRPCIIFMDEMDAVGRKRSSDGESSTSEKDNTLNSLLVELDGFKENSQIFLIGATNRIDILDSALLRPGRIDKKIYIGLPDSTTRKEIIKIHIKQKPHDSSIEVDNLVDTTTGFTGAQIESLLNEAMLYALRYNNTEFTLQDFDVVSNKMIAGWQPTETSYTEESVERICVHEMGHALIGLFTKYHPKMKKAVINLSSPKMPGYTIFYDSNTQQIFTKESLFEHLMILLAGRVAEEIIYGQSVTTGALNDFEEALKTAERMISNYGMGMNAVYPSSSEKYKEKIDTEVLGLLNRAYEETKEKLRMSKELLVETSKILKEKKVITHDTILHIIKSQFFYEDGEYYKNIPI